MTDNVNVKEIAIKEVNKTLMTGLKDYRNVINFMSGDAPIGVLCLPRQLETKLVDKGFLRVYDLFDHDLAKIEGITDLNVTFLTSRLNQFLSMS
jgi:hypothetical protein